LRLVVAGNRLAVVATTGGKKLDTPPSSTDPDEDRGGGAKGAETMAALDVGPKSKRMVEEVIAGGLPDEKLATSVAVVAPDTEPEFKRLVEDTVVDESTGKTTVTAGDRGEEVPGEPAVLPVVATSVEVSVEEPG